MKESLGQGDDDDICHFTWFPIWVIAPITGSRRLILSYRVGKSPGMCCAGHKNPTRAHNCAGPYF